MQSQSFNFFSFYTSLAGRANRRQIWLLTLVPYVVLYLLATWIDFALISPDLVMEGEEADSLPTPWASLTILAITLWPMIAVAVRRLHDRGRSGWFYLLMLVPILNIWIFIEILFLRGQEGDNRFGPAPASS